MTPYFTSQDGSIQIYHGDCREVLPTLTEPVDWTQPGDLIVDPYMGSGPVPRAAMNLGRRCIGIELKEEYAEIAARRLQQAVLPLGDIA